MSDHLRHHRDHAELHGAFGQGAYGRFAERVARSLGTPQFLIGQTLFLIVWIIVNGIVLRGGAAWDVYPFILLNLMLSFQAAYSAPLILVAENRAGERDKAREDADARHREEIAAEHAAQLHALREMAAEIIDRLNPQTDGGLRVLLEAIEQLGDAPVSNSSETPGG